MRAVWLVLVAGFRRQWLLLGLLIAMGSGFVLASAAAGHRADSAFPRYLASHGYDAIVYTVQDRPHLGPQDGVAQVAPVQMPFYYQPVCSCHRRINTGSFSVREVPPADLARVAKLVAGRMPDPSSPVEALASFTLQRDYGVRLGTVITLPMAGASQRDAVFKALAGNGPPPRKATGPRMAMRVVGIVAAENEFSYGQGTSYTLYPGPAFAVATTGAPALTSYYVRLRHGQADFARFEARTSRLEGTGVQDLDRPAATITSSIHPQAVGWLVLAALAGLAAATVVGPALARQASTESADDPVLATLGLSPRQLATRIMLRTLVVAVSGAAGGIAVATLLSPLAPLGEARLAEPDPGLSFDAPVLGLGALATVAVVLALGALPALRAARVGDAAGRAPVARPSVIAGRRRGGRCAARVGHRHPARPGAGPGTRAVPVGTALIGSVAGVAALCATAVFGSSLAHLTATPALYGAPYQYFFNSSGPGAVGQALGMVRRQLATIVFWQATTVAVIAIAAGIPLGIAAGRAIWRAFATSLGVVPVPAVQAWLIVALAAGALVAANALAAVPAMSAARSRPGQLLRTE